MHPLLDANNLQGLDAHTITTQGIKSIDLMDRACAALLPVFEEKFEQIARQYPKPPAIWVLCGTGNNGGDGLGLARLLTAKNYACQVLICAKPKPKPSANNQQQQQRWNKTNQPITWVQNANDLPKPTEFIVLIDALFGTGLRQAIRPLPQADLKTQADYASIINTVNTWPAWRVALDLPSGLPLASPLNDESVVFAADWVLSIGYPKAALLLPQLAQYAQTVTQVPIGLDAAYANSLPAWGYLLEEKDLTLPLRTRITHKKSHGVSWLIAGSQGMYGAALLASKAALRAGLGCLQVHTPQKGVNLLHHHVPEALITADAHNDFITHVDPQGTVPAALAIGCGLGQHYPTAQAVAHLIEQANYPLILDADALNILALFPKLQTLLPPNSLLTPHEGELKRLIGTWTTDYDKLDKCQAWVEERKVILLVKGAHSAVIVPNARPVFNNTGHPSLATAGSGDVLTGLLLGLCGQGLSTKAAAYAGMWIHGRAGEWVIQANEKRHSLIASDLVEALPIAMAQLSAALGI